MVDIAFFFSAASLAASSCLPNFCDLLIIRGALQSLSQQYKLQAAMLSWQDGLSDGNDVAELARHIAPEHHFLAIKTATMVAGISRSRQDNSFINPEEDQLLAQLGRALSLSPERIAEARHDAEEQICERPTLWQVLYACFGSQYGSQFERQILT
jgi:hypothetical protein